MHSSLLFLECNFEMAEDMAYLCISFQEAVILKECRICSKLTMFEKIHY